MYAPPPGTPPFKSLDLKVWCEPQSYLLRLLAAPKHGGNLGYLCFYLGALIAGAALLGVVVVSTMRAAPEIVDSKQGADERYALPRHS